MIGSDSFATVFAWPLQHPVLADAVPCDVFKRLQEPQQWLWLDCADPRAINGWSYLCSAPAFRVEFSHDCTVIIDRDGHRSDLPHTGMKALQSHLRQHLRTAPVMPPGSPPFVGGWAGCLAYDLTDSDGKFRDSVSDACPSTLAFFDMFFAYSHHQRQWWAVSLSIKEAEARGKMERMIKQIAPAGNKLLNELPRFAECDVAANFSADEFTRRVRNALSYIAAGDIYQINVSQQFSVPWTYGEAALYAQLRAESPGALSAFIGSAIHDGDRAILSVSPELFLRVRDRQVLTRPIKGTRPLGTTALEMSAAARDLASSPKERAELNMIIDLERNDLGRVCDYGSVEVLTDGDIETLPTLLHRVASIRGRLHASFDAADLLQATFPGGSVTGAPKLRAMQIIDELENVPRGPYCGAIGWIGVNGDMELNIAIRTAVLDVKKQRASYHAGSGIVADSDPRSEYEETLHKAAAFFRAVNARASSIGYTILS